MYRFPSYITAGFLVVFAWPDDRYNLGVEMERLRGDLGQAPGAGDGALAEAMVVNPRTPMNYRSLWQLGELHRVCEYPYKLIGRFHMVNKPL